MLKTCASVFTHRMEEEAYRCYAITVSPNTLRISAVFNFYIPTLLHNLPAKKGMKKVIFALFLSAALLTAHAQLKVNISVNIDTQPDWGPTGYDHVDYYYMPDIDCYYDVPNKQYVYLSGKTWKRSATLPAKYGHFDLYKGYKVVINKPKPYLHSQTYRTKYAQYKGHASEPVIRDSHDTKYEKAKNNRGHHNEGKHH